MSPNRISRPKAQAARSAQGKKPLVSRGKQPISGGRKVLTSGAKKPLTSSGGRKPLIVSVAEVYQAAQKAHSRLGAVGLWQSVPAKEVVAELLVTRPALRLALVDERKLVRAVKKALDTPTSPAAVPLRSSSERTVTLDSETWRKAIGPVYDSEQTRSLLGEPPHMLTKLARERCLLALHTKDGNTVYPVFQFAGPRVLPGLDSVLCSFPEDDADLLWTIASWMRKPLTTLGERSVIDALRNGDVDAATQAARSTANRWSR